MNLSSSNFRKVAMAVARALAFSGDSSLERAIRISRILLGEISKRVSDAVYTCKWAKKADLLVRLETGLACTGA